MQTLSLIHIYYEKEIGYKLPSRTPFVGKNFNVTRAGIHADGLLKNEEIYNIFDTEKFLNRPVMVAVSNTSGLAGIAHWITTYFRLKDVYKRQVYDKVDVEEEIRKNAYETEAEVIRELAEKPCIILGRCASEILKDQSNVFNIYVCAEKEDRIHRVMELESLSRDEAEARIRETDEEREKYYYQMCIRDRVRYSYE